MANVCRNKEDEMRSVTCPKCGKLVSIPMVEDEMETRPCPKCGVGLRVKTVRCTMIRNAKHLREVLGMEDK